MYHGVHVSPILLDDKLYMNVLHTNGWWVFAVDKATGKEVWKIDRPSDAIGESKESYASPVLWKNNGEWNLVVLGADYTTGHRLSDGKELWRLGDLNPKAKYSTALRIIASPLATTDQLYVPTARNGVFVTLKQGASGTIKNGSPYEAWRIGKGAPDVPCPLEHDGILYLQNAVGPMLAVDAKTGQKLYEERVTGERYRGSPIYADGKIYTIGRDSGTVSVIKAGPKYELLAQNVLSDEGFTASPAVSNGRLYIRGLQALYAISEGGK
jgi:outer membrane protein assembly factor BamB